MGVPGAGSADENESTESDPEEADKAAASPDGSTPESRPGGYGPPDFFAAYRVTRMNFWLAQCDCDEELDFDAHAECAADAQVNPLEVLCGAGLAVEEVGDVLEPRWLCLLEVYLSGVECTGLECGAEPGRCIEDVEIRKQSCPAPSPETQSFAAEVAACAEAAKPFFQ